MTVTELTVILKCEEKTYKEKFLVYESYSMSEDDPVILEYINTAKASLKSEPEEILVRVSMVVLEGEKKAKRKE
jgi:hypothetical protein